MSYASMDPMSLVRGKALSGHRWLVRLSDGMSCHAEVHRMEKGAIRLSPCQQPGGFLALIAVDGNARYALTGQGRPAADGAETSQQVHILDADATWTVDTLGVPLRLFCVWFSEKIATHLYAPPATRLIGFDHTRMRARRNDVTLAEIAAAIVATSSLGASSVADVLSHMVRAFVSYLCCTCALFSADPRDRNETLAPWEIRKATDLMRSRLGERVCIRDVSASCGLSTGHFSRLFKKTTGLSTYQWLVEQRVEKAKELLTHTRLPLCDIAFSCGFADQAHFTRVFAKRANTTPLVWRRLTQAAPDAGGGAP